MTSVSYIYLQLSLGIRGGLVAEPQQIPKFKDVSFLVA